MTEYKLEFLHFMILFRMLHARFKVRHVDTADGCQQRDTEHVRSVWLSVVMQSPVPVCLLATVHSYLAGRGTV